ncbi:MAG: hypothetical protein Q7U66_08165 [Methylobacter sp.]|nr:hypothetical protein [Methylobacter sp.]
MKLNLICLWAALTLFSGITFAAEYVYRDLMANTLPSAGCEVESEAIVTASKPYNITRYSKTFCQSQGYGWHVEKVKDEGKAACTTCSGTNQGKSQCHLEDVVVTCKRIKPGSVGMLPGKS